jgi:ABC-type glycerol-3-phosphate transport system permease component
MSSQNSTRLEKKVASRQRWLLFFRSLPGKFIVYFLLSLWAAISLFGFIWVILTSLKTNQEIYSIKSIFGLPAKFQWVNYVHAWTRSHMGNFFVNSVVVTVTSVLLIALVASMASYILARFKFRGSRPLLTGFILGTAIPVQLILIPLYLMFLDIKLYDSLLGLILVYTAVSMPFSVLVLTGFFRSLPQELEEAAILDGASEYAIFWKVMGPLAMPGIITVSIFNFLDIWNEYMIALLLIKTPERNTVPLGLYNLKWTQQYAADWAGLFAGLVIVMIPTVVAYLLLQNRITKGMTVGALKG